MNVRIGMLLVALAGLFALTPARAQEEKPNRLRAVLESAKTDATRIRGLEFLSDLEVGRITPDDLKEAMLRDMNRIFGEGDQVQATEELLQKLLILPEGMTAERISSEFFPSTVAANYNPFTKRISFLREMRRPEALKSVMVHELAHALQDQHFNLALLLLQDDISFDRLLAYGALVEGDAENVQRNFDTKGMLNNTPLPLIRAYGQSQIKGYLERMKDFPMGVARAFIFQYFDGLLFVESVKRAGKGYRSVDAAYRDPPTTTEQILHPAKYLVRDLPVTIEAPVPPEGWRILTENTLGELGVSIVVEQHLGEGKNPDAAPGWDGDRVLLLAGPEERRLLVWYTTWDTPKDAEEFEQAALDMLRVRHPGWTHHPPPGRLPPFRVLRKGNDVLFADGLPPAGGKEILAALLKADKVETLTVRTGFGTK